MGTPHEPQGESAPRQVGELASAPAPARQETLRELNLASVFGVILDAAVGAKFSRSHDAGNDSRWLRDGGDDSAVGAGTPPSRADIAATTGLTRATVSKLVDSLVAGGLVTELDPISTRKAGRPAIPLIPAPHTVVGLGAEISVDYLALRAMDLAGEVVAERIIEGSFRDSTPAPVLRQLGEAVTGIHEELREQNIRACGVVLAVPGLVESPMGLLRLAPNLGWRDVDILRGLAAGMGTLPALPVSVGNEANLAALAEGFALQGLIDHDGFAYINGDVGIGAAMVFGGHAFQGSHGWSGEIGHVVITPEGPRCRCGARGCLEQYAGLEIVMARAGLGTGGHVAELVDAATTGESMALESLAVAGDALGIALSNLANLFDVNHIALGGIFAPLTPWLKTPIQQQLNARVLAAPWACPSVGNAIVADMPALTGAALSALTSVRTDPAGWLAEN